METIKLLLQLVEAVAWPGVALVAVLVFKESITSLLGRLHDAEIPGGVKLNFEKELHHAEDLSRQVMETVKEKKSESIPIVPRSEVNARMVSLGLRPSPSGLDLDYYRRLATQDPNIALAGLRMEFEILARNLARGFKVEVKDRDTANGIFRKLNDEDFISSNQYKLIISVLKMCNAAIHGTTVTHKEADSVLDVAKILADDYIAWLSWGFEDGSSLDVEGNDDDA